MGFCKLGWELAERSLWIWGHRAPILELVFSITGKISPPPVELAFPSPVEDTSSYLLKVASLFTVILAFLPLSEGIDSALPEENVITSTDSVVMQDNAYPTQDLTLPPLFTSRTITRLKF